MPNIFPAQTKVHPSFTEQGLILTFAQPSGAWRALESEKPRVKLGNGDLAVYAHALDIRTDSSTSQASSNFLPSATLTASYYSTASYLIKGRAQYDHHDIAAAANYNVDLVAAQDLGVRQGIFQQMRNMLLYGFNPANGEGLLNTPNIVNSLLPPDTYGNTTVQTYDAGQMAIFLLNQIVALKSAMYQTEKNRIVLVGPMRVLLQLQYANVVQLTSYQRIGGGTETTAGLIQSIGNEVMGDMIEFCYDDTLIGKGTNDSDAVIITIPEIQTPAIKGINTNEFGELDPKNNAVNIMYTDMPRPRKIPTPVPDGGITEVQEIRATSGWCLRNEGLRVVSMPFS